MRKSHFLSLCFLSFFYLSQAQNTSVYVSAHADDWQLFMNPNAYNSVKANEKVIFLHTTAGDAGNGTGNNNYYLAREEGSLRALRFMSNTFRSGAGACADMNPTVVNINGHTIQKYTYRNITAYFLRLPDGGGGGGGYILHNYKSLQKLYNGSVTNLPAIDGSTNYASKADLQATLKSLIERERSGNLTFNIADTDSSRNPGDHSDHIYSSRIMQDVANEIGGVTLNLYQEYNTSGKAQNVSNQELIISAGTWGATASGLSDNCHHSTWDNGHNGWIGKQYFRTITTPGGGGNPGGGNNNIALNKSTTVSSYEGNHQGSFANDGIKNLGNYWGANPYAQWWQVDLGDNYDVNRVIVHNYYDGSRYYRYDVQGSTDGINWQTIADFSNNTTPANSNGNSFNVNTRARYLRVNMKYNSANIGVHIIEFEAYGNLSSDDTNTNIALNKNTNVSSYESTRQGSFANDGIKNLNNWWGANPYAQWWQVDLGDDYDVNRVVVYNYYDGSRYYRYDVQGSVDGVNWQTVADFSNNTTPATSNGNSFNVNATARYLRVNMKFNSANVGVHIIEFEAYGTLHLERVAAPDYSDLAEEDFRVYPNPSGDIFNVDLSNYMDKEVKFFVTDLSGNTISHGIFDEDHSETTIIEMSSYRNGTYILNLKVEDRKLKRKKLVLLRDY